MERARREGEVRELSQARRRTFPFGRIIGRSPAPVASLDRAREAELFGRGLGWRTGKVWVVVPGAPGSGEPPMVRGQEYRFHGSWARPRG